MLIHLSLLNLLRISIYSKYILYKDMVDNLTEEDNPVIMIFKIKE